MKKSDVMTVETSSERLRMRLQAMAKIGATANGGCNRQALTDEDKAGRDLFIQWCENVGCIVTIDHMGNIFDRPSRSRSQPATGDYSLSQPEASTMESTVYWPE